jgi:hypothetical protein
LVVPKAKRAPDGDHRNSGLELSGGVNAAWRMPSASVRPSAAGSDVTLLS